MIRDIMMGRYLRPDVSHVNEKARVKGKAYTTMPLLTVKKSMINFFYLRVGSVITYGPGRSWIAG
jgi:hypothetical protein